MYILSIEDMTVMQAVFAVRLGRRTRRKSMLLRRTGFNRVETEPLGGMVVNYKVGDTGKRWDSGKR